MYCWCGDAPRYYHGQFHSNSLNLANLLGDDTDLQLSSSLRVSSGILKIKEFVMHRKLGSKDVNNPDGSTVPGPASGSLFSKLHFRSSNGGNQIPTNEASSIASTGVVRGDGLNVLDGSVQLEAARTGAAAGTLLSNVQRRQRTMPPSRLIPVICMYTGAAWRP